MAKTLSQLLTDTRQIIGQTEEGNSQFSNAQLTIWLNDGYRRVVAAFRTHPITTRDYSVASASITLNGEIATADFVRLKNPDNSNRYEQLKVINLPELVQMDPDYENADDGIPEYFVRTGAFTGTLYPPPKASVIALTTPLRVQGVEMPTELSSSSDTPQIPSNAHDLLPNYAAFRCYMFLKEDARATQQLTLFRAGVRDNKQVSTEFSRQTRKWRFKERLD